MHKKILLQFNLGQTPKILEDKLSSLAQKNKFKYFDITLIREGDDMNMVYITTLFADNFKFGGAIVNEQKEIYALLEEIFYQECSAFGFDYLFLAELAELVEKDMQKKMTKEEANEILYPNIKAMSWDEGFQIYKKFFNQPIECGTTLNVDGYEARALHGFRMEMNDKHGNALPITEEVLKKQYQKLLEGFEGEYP